MADEFYLIKNFEKFQHYSGDRKPSWIKLHLSVLVDAAFGDLTETQQAHLLKLWLVASQDGGKVVADPSRVRRAIGARSRVDLELFEKKGFISKSARATPPDKRRGEDIKNKDKEKGKPEEKNIEKNFDEDWGYYPRKEGNKKKAFACYKKSVGDDPEKRAAFRAKVEEMKKARTPKYYQHAETFFRNWQDLEFDDNSNGPHHGYKGVAY